MAIATVRDNSGQVSTSTTVTVTFGGAPAERNLMVVMLWTRATAITTPTGWTRTVGVGSGDDHAAFHKTAGASEGTSQAFTVSEADVSAWAYYELSGVNPHNPIRATATEDTTGLTTSRGSGTTDTSPLTDDYAIASFGSRENISAQSFTNSFNLDKNEETPTTVAEITTAIKPLTSDGAVSTTMSWTTSSDTRGLVVVFSRLKLGDIVQAEGYMAESAADVTLSNALSQPESTPWTTPKSGNTLVMLYWSSGGTVTAPTGWTQRLNEGTGAQHRIIWDRVSDGTETSILVESTDAAESHAIVCYEIEGAVTLDVAVSAENTAVTSVNSGSTGTLANADSIAMALCKHAITSDTAFSDSYTVDGEYNGGGSGDTDSLYRTGFAHKILTTTAATSTAGSWTGSSSGHTSVIVYSIIAAAGGDHGILIDLENRKFVTTVK